MAEAAARREARRRRILENSENRMQKIFGASTEDPKEDDAYQNQNHKYQSQEKVINNMIQHSMLQADNRFISMKNTFAVENNVILENENEDVLEQDKNFSNLKSEFPETNIQYTQTDNHFPFRQSDEQYSLKRNLNDCDISNSYPTTTIFDEVTREQNQFSLFSILFFSHFSYILLAISVNIIILAGLDFSLYKSIVTPYVMLAITQICLGNTLKESQESSMLVAALILCNIQPETVYNIKKVLGLSSAIIKDFATYLTSFVLFNWIVSILWTGSSYVQFF